MENGHQELFFMTDLKNFFLLVICILRRDAEKSNEDQTYTYYRDHFIPSWHSPITNLPADWIQFGLSWFLGEKDGNLLVRHGGGDLGFRTGFSMMPRKMMAVAVLCNASQAPAGDITDGIWAILLGAEPTIPKKSLLFPLSKTLPGADITETIMTYQRLKTNQPSEYDFSEGQLNVSGYRLLEMERTEDAIEIFILNVEMFPDAFNTYDSLGEAYMIAGDKDQAIKNYEKSIELNPDNQNGKDMLKKLREK
jgi:hypothetical protein